MLWLLLPLVLPLLALVLLALLLLVLLKVRCAPLLGPLPPCGFLAKMAKSTCS